MRLKFKRGVYTNKGIISAQNTYHDLPIINQLKDQYATLVAPKETKFETIDKSERKRKVYNKKVKPAMEDNEDAKSEQEKQKELKFKDAKIIVAPKSKKEDVLGNKSYPKYVPRAKDLPLITGLVCGKNEYKLFRKGYVYNTRANSKLNSSDYDNEPNEKFDIENEINRLEEENDISVTKYKIKTLG